MFYLLEKLGIGTLVIKICLSKTFLLLLKKSFYVKTIFLTVKCDENIQHLSLLLVVFIIISFPYMCFKLSH